LAGGVAAQRAPGVTQGDAAVSAQGAAVAVLTGVENPVAADGPATAVRGAGKFGLAGLTDGVAANRGNAGTAGGAQQAAGRAGQRAPRVSEGYAGPTTQIGVVADLALVGDAVAADHTHASGVAEAGVVETVDGAVAVVIDAVVAILGRPTPGGVELAGRGAGQRAAGEALGLAGLAAQVFAVAVLAGLDAAVAAVLGRAGRVLGAVGVIAVDVAVAVVVDVVVAVLHRRGFAPRRVELAGGGAGEGAADEALRHAGLAAEVGAVAGLTLVEGAVAAEFLGGQCPAGLRAGGDHHHQKKQTKRKAYHDPTPLPLKRGGFEFQKNILPLSITD